MNFKLKKMNSEVDIKDPTQILKNIFWGTNIIKNLSIVYMNNVS